MARAPRAKKLTFTLMLGDKEIDRLPDGYWEKKSVEMGKVVSEYYSNHIDEWRILCQHLEEEKDNPELAKQRMKRYS